MIARKPREREVERAHPPLRAVVGYPQGRVDGSAAARWVRSQWVEQTARYSVVGIFNTALDAALYLTLTTWLGFGGLKLLAKSLSYATGIANSFWWNRSWTFRSTAPLASTFVPFAIASLVALAINAGAMALGLMLFNQYQVPALAMATGITLLWNFSTSKFLVFKR